MREQGLHGPRTWLGPTLGSVSVFRTSKSYSVPLSGPGSFSQENVTVKALGCKKPVTEDIRSWIIQAWLLATQDRSGREASSGGVLELCLLIAHGP